MSQPAGRTRRSVQAPGSSRQGLRAGDSERTAARSRIQVWEEPPPPPKQATAKQCLACPPPLLPAPRQAQAAMGTMGLPVLLSVLQEDRDDTELLRAALESLALTFGAGEGGPGGTPGAAAAAAAAQGEVRALRQGDGAGAFPPTAAALGPVSNPMCEAVTEAGGPASQSPGPSRPATHLNPCLPPKGAPPPCVMNAELFVRAPDNVRLLLALLEPEPLGTEDFYCRCR
jgi:hypothetical protein